MARVKRGVSAKARHKKVLSKAKGYYGARSKLYKTAKQAVIKAGQYAYLLRLSTSINDNVILAVAPHSNSPS